MASSRGWSDLLRSLCSTRLLFYCFSIFIISIFQIDKADDGAEDGNGLGWFGVDGDNSAAYTVSIFLLI